MVVALLPRNLTEHGVAGGLKVQLAQHGLQQGGMHPLPFAGALPMQQGEQYALAEEHAGGGVADGDAHPPRAAPRLAGDGHQAAHALDDLIDPGPFAVGAVLSEAGNAGVDDGRIDRLDRLVIDAETMLDRNVEVLHHHVCLFGQAHERL